MSQLTTLPPQCAPLEIYLRDGAQLVCPECGHEWSEKRGLPPQNQRK